MRFIAAVPNYNHGESLVNLLNQLLDEGFDEIYVLDDSSTDNSMELLRPFDGKITVIQGPFNIGPAGNRNRIIPHLKPGDVLMSIDADMVLETKGVRKTIENYFSKNPEVVLLGGGIYSGDKPMTYNYGYHQSQFRHGVGIGLERFAQLLHFKPLIRLIRPIAKRFTLNVEIRYFEPKELAVDSVSEAHYYIKGDVFSKLNGYNEDLRYHEGTELGYRIRKSGGVIKFSPIVWATHLEVHPRAKQLRNTEAKKLDKIIENE